MGYVDLSADCGCTSGEEAGDGKHGGVFHPGDQGRRCEDGKVSGSDDHCRIFFSYHESALVGQSFVYHVVKIALFHYFCAMDKYYRHFKGNIYKFVGIAKDSETLEEMVVYQAMYGDHQMWVRPMDMFFGEIERDGKKMPRFQEISEDDVFGLDERFDEVARFVVSEQNAVRPVLQRKLALGYFRAGTILGQLEKAGIVGPENEEGERTVLVKDLEGLEPILSRFASLPRYQLTGLEKKPLDDLYWETMRADQE